jgi:hypothetical protein
MIGLWVDEFMGLSGELDVSACSTELYHLTATLRQTMTNETPQKSQAMADHSFETNTYFWYTPNIDE